MIREYGTGNPDDHPASALATRVSDSARDRTQMDVLDARNGAGRDTPLSSEDRLRTLQLDRGDRPDSIRPQRNLVGCVARALEEQSDRQIKRKTSDLRRFPLCRSRRNPVLFSFRIAD